MGVPDWRGVGSVVWVCLIGGVSAVWCGSAWLEGCRQCGVGLPDWRGVGSVVWVCLIGEVSAVWCGCT